MKVKEKVYRPCAVCGDRATGYHYKAPTCEGCKGFFRRTIQKNVTYVCEWSNACTVDRETRTQCQKCRFDKCLAEGMTPHTVLSERQRVVKRQIREENRIHRAFNELATAAAAAAATAAAAVAGEAAPPGDGRQTQPVAPAFHSVMMMPLNSDLFGCDDGTITTILQSYREIFNRSYRTTRESNGLEQRIPSTSKIIDFAKSLPGFTSLTSSDQICLLQGSCLEILCLRAALRYDTERQGFPLADTGKYLTLGDLTGQSGSEKISSLFDYATRIQQLSLDETEAALLAATLCFQSSRVNLREPERVELYQDSIMNISLRYAKTRNPDDDLRWMKSLLRIPPLRGFGLPQLQDRVYISIDQVNCIPPAFLCFFQQDL